MVEQNKQPNTDLEHKSDPYPAGFRKADCAELCPNKVLVYKVLVLVAD